MVELLDRPVMIKTVKSVIKIINQIFQFIGEGVLFTFTMEEHTFEYHKFLVITICNIRYQGLT